MNRSAGILLAVSSLPSGYGIGSFGKAALEWIDFLERAGQKHWQILPLGPTSWGDSPYMSFSAFAINPYYIDLDILREQGLLDRADLEGRWGSSPERADYGLLYKRRETILRRAFSRFRGGLKSEGKAENAVNPLAAASVQSNGQAYQDFCEKNAFWLRDYCLFMAIKQKMGGRSWLEWGDEERLRDKDALERCEKECAEDLGYHAFVQFTAFSQWQAVKGCANGKGISLIGDMPIYVALDSADVWANGGLFQLDRERKPLRVAGCPPDAFSATGQLWGNPLYNWEAIAETGFAWWISRLRSSFSLYDIVRIDHFRGFESYWSIPFGAEDARGGEWVKGPGLGFVNAVNGALPGAAIIAEDLGFLTPEVRGLLAASGYPGMKVLQFAFDSREESDYMPYSYPRNCVAYTGTHDNTTTLGWFKTAQEEDIALARDYLGVRDGFKRGDAEGGDIAGVWAFIRAALSSVANLAVIPMQDYLCLGDEARMNHPSTLGGINWQWRMKPGAADDALADKIARLTKINGRQ